MTTPAEYECAECGDTYTSIKAALLCEDADIAADIQARRNKG